MGVNFSSLLIAPGHSIITVIISVLFVKKRAGSKILKITDVHKRRSNLMLICYTSYLDEGVRRRARVLNPSNHPAPLPDN